MFMHTIHLISAECRSAYATQSVWGADAHPRSSQLIAPSIISVSIIYGVKHDDVSLRHSVHNLSVNIHDRRC